jgi:hypothetical protein
LAGDIEQFGDARVLQIGIAVGVSGQPSKLGSRP